MFECGDYEALLDDISAILAEAVSRHDAELLKKVEGMKENGRSKKTMTDVLVEQTLNRVIKLIKKMNVMNFLKKIYYQYRARKDFEKRLLMSSACHRATQDVLHYMCSAVGIDEMRKMLDEAEKSGNKYVNLAEMYASAVTKRIYGKRELYTKLP